MEQHAEVPIGKPWYQRIPTWRDAVATLLVLTIVILLGSGAHQMVVPLVTAQQPRISLSPAALPVYALRTTIRIAGGLMRPTSGEVLYRGRLTPDGRIFAQSGTEDRKRLFSEHLLRFVPRRPYPSCRQ